MKYWQTHALSKRVWDALRAGALGCFLLIVNACTTTNPYVVDTQWQAHVLGKSLPTPRVEMVKTSQQWQSAVEKMQKQGWQPIAITKVTQAKSVAALQQKDPKQQGLLQFARGLRAQYVLVLVKQNAEIRAGYFARKPRLLLIIEPTTVPETGLTGLLILNMKGDWVIPSGLLKGDVILAVEGDTTTKPVHLANIPAKKVVTMTLLRFGKIGVHQIYTP